MSGRTHHNCDGTNCPHWVFGDCPWNLSEEEAARSGRCKVQVSNTLPGPPAFFRPKTPENRCVELGPGRPVPLWGSPTEKLIFRCRVRPPAGMRTSFHRRNLTLSATSIIIQTRAINQSLTPSPCQTLLGSEAPSTPLCYFSSDIHRLRPALAPRFTEYSASHD